MPRSLWTEEDEVVEVEDFQSFELPIIVIDWNALHDEKDAKVERLWFIENIWRDFNVVLWRKPKFFRKKYNEIDGILQNHYDFTMAKSLECDFQRLQRYLIYNRTIVLTSDDGLRQKLHGRSANIFDRNTLIKEFPFLSRRNK